MTIVRARTPSGSVPVEEGGRSTFDGNATSFTTAWFQRPPGTDLCQDDLDLLMTSTIRGHLSWFCYPCKDYD